MDRILVVFGFVGLTINICMNSILIPQWGAVGASIGTLIAEILTCIFQCYSVRKYIPIKKYIKYAFPLVLVGFVMFMILFFGDMRRDVSIYSMAVKILMGVVIYLAGLFIYYIVLKKNRDPDSQKLVKIIKQLHR